MQRGRNEPLAADTAAVARAVHATEGPASLNVVDGEVTEQFGRRLNKIYLKT